MKLLFLIGCLFSLNSFAGAYLGFNYGYTGYTSDALEEFSVNPEGAGQNAELEKLKKIFVALTFVNHFQFVLFTNEKLRWPAS